METIQLSDRFRLSIDKVSAETHWTFHGDLDEDANFKSVPVPTTPVLVINTESIALMNSSGIRSWVLYFKNHLSEKSIRFTRTPRLVVDQMNILQGFLPPGAKIDSFFLPYYCGACDSITDQLLSADKDFVQGTVDRKEGVRIEDEIVCGQCAQPAQIDVISSKYFRFLKYRA